MHFLKKNHLVTALLASFICTSFFNTCYLATTYKLYSISKQTGSEFEFLLSFLESVIFGFIFFFSFMFHRRAFCFVLYSCFFIGSICSYFVYFYQIKIDSNIIGTALAADSSELKSFIEPYIFIWIAFALMSARLIAQTYPQNNLSNRQHKLAFITSCFIFFATFFDGNVILRYYPYNFIIATKDYLLERLQINQPAIDISQNDFSFSNNSKDLSIVLVIGESSRSDHFSLNGYHRNTNPLLGKLPNVFSFKDASACDAFTRTAVPCLLTRNRGDSLLETSFIAVFRKLGFNTAYLSNQFSYSTLDKPLNRFHNEAENVAHVNTNSYSGLKLDEDLLPFFDRNLGNHSNFIVLHTIGSHHPYSIRYSDKFAIFTPICKLKFYTYSMNHCTIEERINSYDNSIRYTDFFLSEVISRLKDRNALLIYVSDHGESLGEDGYFLHGNKKRKEQLSIPIIFWVSEKYKSNFSREYQALQSNKSLKLSYENIFHSVLGCSSVKSDIVSDKYNICGLKVSAQ